MEVIVVIAVVAFVIGNYWGVGFGFVEVATALKDRLKKDWQAPRSTLS